MTQPIVHRIVAFKAGSLPDPKTLPDHLIMSVSIDGLTRTLLESDGLVWAPVGRLPPVATTAAAIAGVENDTVITPLRLAEVLASFGIGSTGENGYVSAGYVSSGYVSP